MSKNQTNMILVGLIIMIAIFGYLNLSIKSEYTKKREEFIKFEKSAKEIYLLKKLKKNKKAIISGLNSIKRPKIVQRASSTIYTFESLNLNDLHRLIKRVQGSFLEIKSLEIQNDTTNHATMILEIAK